MSVVGTKTPAAPVEKKCDIKKLIPGVSIHFVEQKGDKCKAGVINFVHNPEGAVSAHIFYPGATAYEERCVNYSFPKLIARSWHYTDECACKFA